MIYVIIIFGLLILLAGMIILINPETLLGPIRDNSDKPLLQVVAVVVRLILGILLVSESESSGYPIAIEILGWLAIVAAITLALMGRENFKRLMSWALSLIEPYGRVGGVLASLFGAFIVYAFI
ncbi:PigN domain-containing protein [Candidatus Thiodiazotropha sp. CDECU1]|uniref:PigN domain-containing protein n=1 Tax=Candidatus Thiodiazotropha sp. CDECU1 TaxID=3065865 RepID=UPI0029318F56|nr:PigN domain-containing protein [Candidatus Thiodiazotropha sp. CDECU1]